MKDYKGYGIEKPVGQVVEFLPHGQGGTARRPLAGAGAGFKALHRGKGALGQAQYFADLIILGGAVQAVAAALAVEPVHHFGLCEHRHDLFEPNGTVFRLSGTNFNIVKYWGSKIMGL